MDNAFTFNTRLELEYARQELNQALMSFQELENQIKPLEEEWGDLRAFLREPAEDTPPVQLTAYRRRKDLLGTELIVKWEEINELYQMVHSARQKVEELESIQGYFQL